MAGKGSQAVAFHRAGSEGRKQGGGFGKDPGTMPGLVSCVIGLVLQRGLGPQVWLRPLWAV